MSHLFTRSIPSCLISMSILNSLCIVDLRSCFSVTLYRHYTGINHGKPTFRVRLVRNPTSPLSDRPVNLINSDMYARATCTRTLKWILVRQEVGQWVRVLLGPGPVLDARAFQVPIPKVCTSCRTNIHVGSANLACTCVRVLAKLQPLCTLTPRWHMIVSIVESRRQAL